MAGLVRRRCRAASARGPNVTGLSPGGEPMHFCEQEPAASIPPPHASISTGTPPSDVTQSIAMSAPWRCAISATSGTGCQAPVEVSAWTSASSLAGFFRSSASNRSGAITSPGAASTTRTVAPVRAAIWARRWPK